MLCPIKVNSNTIELTVNTCYCVLDLLCVICNPETGHNQYQSCERKQNFFQKNVLLGKFHFDLTGWKNNMKHNEVFSQLKLITKFDPNYLVSH